jgi:dihydroorotate dehydrogenase electron transfer subunit
VGQQIGRAREQGLVALIEGALAIAINVYLPEYGIPAPYQHDHLGAGPRATGKVVIHLGHVANDLIGSRGDGRPAHAHANGYPHVLGWLAYVIVEHEDIALEQVYSDPVVVIAALFDQFDSSAQYLVERRIRVDQLFYLEEDLVIAHGLEDIFAAPAFATALSYPRLADRLTCGLMIETVAKVKGNLELVPGYRLLTLRFDRELEIEAGQFAMLRARGFEEPLLRRAMAIYRIDGPQQLSFLYKVLGRGTQALARVGVGQEVEALLPLGNGWLAGGLPQKAIVVCGGIGSASAFLLCQELARAGSQAIIFFGAASRDVAIGCGLEDFRALGLPMHITTDDGSLGEPGLVTAALERHLSRENVAGAVIYACGPWAMMRRVSEIAEIEGLRCLVSIETPMGCGFGVCVGCAVAVKDPHESYRRACVDGPIFPAQVIRWDIEASSR